jgi:hypothetical protein
MYVRPYTPIKKIEQEIEKLEQRLKSKLLTWQDREMLQEELDYLNSFLPQEVG